MEEKAVLFGDTDALVGVLTQPDGHCCRPGPPAVVILNAGFIHRVGPNRIYVKLARNIASLGLSALRFDFTGIGDSDNRRDNMPFEQSAVRETKQAMDYLESRHDIHEFILTGICSGASVALRTACHDGRVVGLVGINGTFMDTVQSQCLREHLENGIRRRYYRKYLLDPGRWWKLLTGKTHLRDVVGVVIGRMRKLAPPRPRARQVDLSAECRLALDRGVKVLLIYSEGSSAWDAFHLTLEPGLKPRRPSDKLKIETVENVDHVFTPLWSQELLIDLVHRWVHEFRSADPAPNVLPGGAPMSLPSMEPNGRTRI
jgi:pimeloyl-ACP methyl ester carboxylesterase